MERIKSDIGLPLDDVSGFLRVEAEVSPCLLSLPLVIGRFLKWDVIKDPREENNGMIFIAYLVGFPRLSHC